MIIELHYIFGYISWNNQMMKEKLQMNDGLLRMSDIVRLKNAKIYI